jgi:hypothetical protein
MMLASGSAVGSSWTPSSPDLDSGSVFRVPESAIPSGSSAGRLTMAHTLFERSRKRFKASER